MTPSRDARHGLVRPVEVSHTHARATALGAAAVRRRLLVVAVAVRGARRRRGERGAWATNRQRAIVVGESSRDYDASRRGDVAVDAGAIGEAREDGGVCDARDRGAMRGDAGWKRCGWRRRRRERAMVGWDAAKREQRWWGERPEGTAASATDAWTATCATASSARCARDAFEWWSIGI